MDDQSVARGTVNHLRLSVSDIANSTERPARVLGMHFFNPVHIMKLVELVRHDRTDADVLESVRAVAVAMKKDPIIVRDSPGFASSRLGVVLGLVVSQEPLQGRLRVETAMRVVVVKFHKIQAGDNEHKRRKT